jgi:hypothetical protein
VLETAADLERLQAVIDSSYADAGIHLARWRIEPDRMFTFRFEGEE